MTNENLEKALREVQKNQQGMVEALNTQALTLSALMMHLGIDQETLAQAASKIMEEFRNQEQDAPNETSKPVEKMTAKEIDAAGTPPGHPKGATIFGG